MKKGHRGGRRARRGSVVLNAFCAGLALILLGLGVYVAQWSINLGRIRRESARYAGLYTASTLPPAPAATPSPTPTLTPAPTVRPTLKPTSNPTVEPTPRPTAVGPDADMPVPVDQRLDPATEAEALPAASKVTAEPPRTTAVAPDARMPVVMDEPIPTPDGDTLVIALPTAPPIQQSFLELLSVNPDTVGFLNIEGMLALPVVQRENDNDHYLNHSFQGAKAQEGTLFLDGLNRLTPEDDCLIVYGHNMKNRTMFGRLSEYADITCLHQHPVIRFDTIYENRSYVAFAAFTASMEAGNPRYFDVRNFIFDPEGFDKFVQRLRSRSVFASPIEVVYGDRLLLLVTCNYASREGRFILALRQLRPDETESGMWAQALQSTQK